MTRYLIFKQYSAQNHEVGQVNIKAQCT